MAGAANSVISLQLPEFPHTTLWKLRNNILDNSDLFVINNYFGMIIEALHEAFKPEDLGMKPRITLVAIALLNTTASHANLFLSKPGPVYPARITGQFLTGHDQQLGGFGDLMLPVMGSENRMFFTDGTIMLGQNQRHTYSGGLGYRQIKETQFGAGVLGAYAFADYFQTELKNQFWQLNPGLEWLMPYYEARLQAYIPVSSRNQKYLNTYASAIPQDVLADSGRSNNLSRATGHVILDTPVNLIEQAGTGAELELGRFFDVNQGMWARMGAYHFNYRDSKSINGVEANLELAVNRRVSVLVQDNFDNQNKNRFSVGLRVNFGGADAPRNTLQYQMTSPIIRHQARQSYGEAAPLRKNFQATGPTFNRFEDVWFFSPDGMFPAGTATTFADCTAEKPCSTIDTPTAQKIAVLDPNANLFFASGNYLIPASSPRWVNLQDGQSVWGRNTGWITPAAGNARPLIEGGLIWGNENNNVNPILANGAIYDTRVQNINQEIPSSVFRIADESSVVGVGSTGRLFIHNSDIMMKSTNGLFAVGVRTGSDVTINNSAIMAIQQGKEFGTGVIAVFSGGDVMVNSSIINAQMTGTLAFANGILSGGATHVSRSIIAVNTNGEGLAIGIAAADNVTINNSAVTAGAEGGGAQAINSGGNATISNSLIVAEATGLSPVATGIIAEDGSTVNHSKIMVAANGTGNTTLESTTALGINSKFIILNDSTVNVITNAYSQALSGGIIAESITFIGNKPSFITAIATGKTAIAEAIRSPTISNNSNPKSKCSTNGVDYNDC